MRSMATENGAISFHVNVHYNILLCEIKKFSKYLQVISPNTQNFDLVCTWNSANHTHTHTTASCKD